MMFIIFMAILATSIVGLFFLDGESCDGNRATADMGKVNEGTNHSNATLDEDDDDDFMSDSLAYRRNMSHHNRYVVGHGGFGSVGRF